MQGIYTAKGIKDWDSFTIDQRNISSIQLMVEASQKFCDQFIKDFPNQDMRILIGCGVGNNGGDGFNIARILTEMGYPVEIFFIKYSNTLSADCQSSLDEVKRLGSINIHVSKAEEAHSLLPNHDVFIDAIFGSGLNRPLSKWLISLFNRINELTRTVVAVDIPSGVPINNKGWNTYIEADLCYTFQSLKFPMIFPEFSNVCAEVKCLHIGLVKEYSDDKERLLYQLESRELQRILRKRKRFSHKGSYGHGLFIGGSENMAGTAILSARAALRSGIGLISCNMSHDAYLVALQSRPEIMYTDIDPSQLEKFSAVAIGPGLGITGDAVSLVKTLLHSVDLPMVLDADALNCIAQENLHKEIPHHSIITPHPKEFERLFGSTKTGYERYALQLAKSMELGIYIVLKDAYTYITTPEGMAYVSIYGNPGMATGGSGDVLTGIILSLLAQSYNPEQACIAGVLLHGLAGDEAALTKGTYGLVASDIIDVLPGVIRSYST